MFSKKKYFNLNIYIFIWLFLYKNIYAYELDSSTNGGRIYLDNSSNYNNQNSRFYPIGFKQVNNKNKIKDQDDESESVINNKEIEKKIKYKPLIEFEIGVASLGEAYLEINDQLNFPTINRSIEFYSQNIIAPVFKIHFRDLSLNRHDNLLFRNSLKTTYIKYSTQTPFLSNSGIFPYNQTMSIGSEISSLSFNWIGALLYRVSILSIGPYIGAGINILNGEAIYVKYSGDLNSSLSENIGIFNGKILERGESIFVANTSSISSKYGAIINLDLSPFRLSVGLGYSITNEANLYWIERSYFLEANYVFSF